MLTITIFAAGLVCLAGVLGLGLGRAQAQVATATAGTARAVAEPTAGERGITLQTLIVTAVLVLMAVAAGVVIVAITNNAAEDLEQANPGIESPCNEVEIYNGVLAATGARGTNGGANSVSGTQVGCIPVCVWSVGDTDHDVDADELSLNRSLTDDLDTGTVSDDETRVFINEDTVNDDQEPDFANSDAVGVRVNAAQNDCITVNSSGQEVS